MIQRTRRRAARALAGGAAALLVACPAPVDPVKGGVLRQVLDGQARHLDAGARARIVDILLAAEVRHDIDALLLFAVAERESHFRPRARGPRGALGLMQIRPQTAREVAARHDLRWTAEEALYEPAFNVRIGAAYLAELKETFGTWQLALAAYNHGPRKVRQTRARGRQVRSFYATRVLGRYQELREAYAAARRRA